MQILAICIFGNIVSLKVGSRKLLFLKEFFGFHTELWTLFPFSHSPEEWIY